MPTYRIDDFLRTADIYIAPEIQNREHYPFTMDAAQRFFHQFRGIPFEMTKTVRAIFIFRGKEVLPRNSFAEGTLYSQNVDELEAYAQRNDGNLPEPVAAILFEVGGTRLVPYIKVNDKHGFVWATTDSRHPTTAVVRTDELKFNGLYFCDNIGSHGANRYLRFYEDGEVIWCLSTGKPGNVVRWFDKNRDATTPQGRYNLQGRKIQFDLTSPNNWEDTFSGEISDDALEIVDRIGLPYRYEFFPDDALTNSTQILGITGELTEDTLKDAYRTTIAKYHPDTVQHLGDEFKQMAAQKAKEVNEAYDFIRRNYSFHD